MDLIDSHAHVDMLKDPAAALNRARQAEVVQVVTIGVDLESSRRAAQLAREHPGVFCTVGLHPHDAAQASEQLFKELKQIARQAPARAIGECGLDFFRDLSPRPVQREAFSRQVELALELDLPLVIHDRDAHDQVAGILGEMGASRVGGVVHCFSGGQDLARQVLDMGFFIGIPGTITFSKAQALRDLVRLVPLERLLLETDCPFLAPVPYRGKPNEPAYLVHTLAALALALGREQQEVAQATTANAQRLYGLPQGKEDQLV